MRLVQIGQDGCLTITSYLIGQNNLPPYATFSHTWQGYDQEVTFDDLINDKGHEKASYKKLLFCAQQARRDDLQYFWIDTCCINTADHTELQEVINSLFRWLQNAAKCYVYLSDVFAAEPEVSAGVIRPSRGESPNPTWVSAFRQSRWFTRTWTLQELLAPPIVEFYSQEGDALGDKSSLAQHIHEITGIPIAALQGAPLGKFSVEERMSWAKGRQATREEDVAYSLLGIFDVYLPVIYGEGRQRALSRLHKAIQWSAGRYAREQEFRARNQLIYDPLNETDIRILIIHPGEQDEDLTAHLETRSLSEPLEYQALSYVWGQEPALHPLRVNESEIVFIKTNLFHALHRMRLPYEPVRLWIDSICIHQSDEEERNRQVQRMGDIYRRARNVWIWLGEEQSDSNRAMDFIPQVNRPDYKWQDPWIHQHEFLALNSLLGRPWFQRGWVIQEAAFSAHSIVFCGNRRVDWRDLTRSVAQVTQYMATVLLDPNFVDQTVWLQSSLNNLFDSSPARRLLEIVDNVFRLREDGQFVRTLDLETLVDLGTHFETTDPRDSIYALMNLAKDTWPTSLPHVHGTITPDYRKNALNVFADFILHCCRVSKSLDIICRPWAPLELHAAWKDYQRDRVHSLNIPSWIIARDQLPFGDPSRRSSHRLHGNSLIEKSGEIKFIAHRLIQPDAEVIRYEGDSIRYLSLEARGLVIGTVTNRSMRMANAVITTDCLGYLRNAFKDIQTPDFKEAEVISRVLSADLPFRRKWSTTDYEEIVHWWQSRFESEEPGIDIEEVLEQLPHGNIREYLELVRQFVWNRRTFRGHTDDGLNRVITGLIPQAARVGDRVCIVYGCSVPVVLRSCGDGSESQYWKLIGEAYVHGYMYGEGVSMAPEARSSAEIIFDIR